jgi:hypothetical protein
MTSRSPILLLLAGAALVAGCAGTAVSREPSRAGPPAPRVAVVAGADASATAIADAVQHAATVRRVGGLPEAQAQAAALAAEGYDVVVGLGAQARAAVNQAAAAEVGAGTRWR